MVTQQRWKLSTPALLTLPAVVVVLALCVVPVLRILLLGFTDPTIGLSNYALLGSSEALRRIVTTMALLCVTATVITVLLAYVIAYAMVHVTRREVRWMFFFILLAFWLSVLVRTFAWIVILRSEGPVNQVLMALGIVSQPVQLVRNTFGVLLGMVHVMLPLAVLPLYSAMNGIDQRLTSAARGLGCSRTRAFLWVFLPLSAPGVVAATVLVFVFSLGFFITPVILGGGRVIMIAEYIRTQFEVTLRWGYAAMLATMLLVSVAATLAIAARFVNLRRIMGGAQ
ncbi:MAG: ABC transporter permease [Bradyrhizobiaceae bacterium]|nr:MAG: ABC transporter permease [Bradyrhizobiaceae bacterium]